MSFYKTQNTLLLDNLMNFYKENNNLDNMLSIINGDSNVSLRIVDWFATNYSKQNYTIYKLSDGNRFKVYIDYKLKLRAYSKKRFDPFCRWERITIPYNNYYIQTTIGQLNFFKWAIQNEVIKYIENNYIDIERDMNSRNSTTKNKNKNSNSNSNCKTRKKREELSKSASNSVFKENIDIIISFN